MANHLCERDLATEGPCFGPRFPPETRAPADRVIDGRYLCLNHIAVLYGDAALYGPKDPATPYFISEHGFWEGEVHPGDYAKVLFVPVGSLNASAEGMWVKVSSVRNGRVTGKLDNRPLNPGALHVKFGQSVHFPLRAVRTVMTRNEELTLRRE